MIRKILNKIKEDYREFITARKRIAELQIQNTSLLQNNAELWHDNVSSFAHYIENMKKTSTIKENKSTNFKNYDKKNTK